MTDSDARPSKRARLDDSTSTATAAAASAAAAPATTTTAPLASTVSHGPNDVDEELERELRAGITEYVCADNLGFRGVLKQRYTDFMVNEIGRDGQVVRLRKVGVDKKVGEKEGRVREDRENEGTGRKGGLKIEENGEEVVKVEGNGVPLKAEEKAEVKKEDDVVEAVPKEEVGEDKKEAVEAEAEAPLSDEDLTTLQSIFGEQATKEIISLVRYIRKNDQKKAKDFKAVIAPPISDKEVRTQAHRCLRRIFPDLLESSMESDQSIRVKAVPPRERKGKKNDRDRNNKDDRNQNGERRVGKLGWEELGGEYLHFTLYKENKDTMEIVGFLGSKLNSGTKSISFAGTKDKRACTVQRICVKRQTAERMNSFNRILFNAAIGDFSHHKHDLRLGDLSGNEFTITLRDCHFQGEEDLNQTQRIALANDIVSKAITDFSEKGFINYYGLQRFGSFAASTDTVGLKLLKGDLKGAVDDLLAYTDSALAAANSNGKDKTVLVSQDDRDRAKALHIWRTTGKGSAALDILPRKFSAERNIVQHLNSRNSKNGLRDRLSDWQGALMCIPRNLRLMYVHAYQSLVWNVVAGKRWTTYGDKAVEGDLVLVHEHKDKISKGPAVPDPTIDQDGEMIINPSGDNSSLDPDDQFERARALTAAEAASGLYSVYDIVLPQPGFDVEYPKNDIGRFYEEFMGSERGGGLDPHNMRRPWREVSLSGGYRKFLTKPLSPLEFWVREYVRPEDQFLETDLQRVRGEKVGGVSVGGGDVDMRDDGEQDEEKKIAVVMKLQLGTSQYATMALRELCKAGGVKAYKPEFMGGR